MRPNPSLKIAPSGRLDALQAAHHLAPRWTSAFQIAQFRKTPYCGRPALRVVARRHASRGSLSRKPRNSRVCIQVSSVLSRR